MSRPVFRRGDPVDLCPIERDDLEFLTRNYNDPEVRRWMPMAEPTNGHQMESDFEDWDDQDDITRFLGCVDGDPVGMISIFHVEETSGRAMMGAWIAPEYQGKGYGSAMTEQMVDYAFTERRLHRLSAGALATNESSRATLESVGFELEGRERENYYVEGEYIDRVVYGLLEHEWDGTD